MNVRPGEGAPAAARQSGHVSRDITYRPDIDGLRAIAVMLVVLNHAGAPFMSGGYVGVDVFFVISGFLITALITIQHVRGRFTFAGFYWRRAKRLLPALYVLMLATLAAGWWLLIPSDYSLLSQSALWATGFASNIFFWRNTGGYFSPDAASFPLLHVWSLSIEEQFYFVWPALLLLLLRAPSKALRIGVVALIAAASLAYAQYEVIRGSTAAYFLIPARGCEFLAGALLYMLWKARRPSAVVANLLSAAGLALILGSAVLLDARSPFPGLAALPACLGSALIIAAPQFGKSLVTRTISTWPFVFVGLISYSVYLWHWPIVSFLKLSRIPITWPVTLAIIAASLALGALSWALLERGFRGLLNRLNGPSLGLAAAGAAAVVAVPVYIQLSQGLPGRFPYALLTQDQLTAERNRYWIDLNATRTNLAAGTGGRLLIIGDSHAYDLAYALRENGYGGRIKLIPTDWRCFNFGHQAVRPEDAQVCAERLEAVLTNPDLKLADAVYLHDHWGGYDEAGLTDMLQRLRAVTKAPIYVFGPQMQFRDDVLTISKTAQAQRYVTVAGINDFARRYDQPWVVERDRRLKAFFATHAFPDVHYISTLEAQCGPELACDILSPAGKYLYFDAEHFTLEGSRRYGARLKGLHPELFPAGSSGSSQAVAAAPPENLTGGPGDDKLDGGPGDDVITGMGGADTLRGHGGNDLIRGGKGNDVIDGGDGDDWISGDRGDDTLTGGRGADTFHSSADAGLDLVTDFNLAEGDRVELDKGTAYTVRQVGADTVIQMSAGRVVLKNIKAASLTPGVIYEQ